MQLPPDLLAHAALPKSTRLVLTALWSLATPGDAAYLATCTVSQVGLAGAAGVSVAQTRRALRQLLDLEIIRRERSVVRRVEPTWALLRSPPPRKVTKAVLHPPKKRPSKLTPFERDIVLLARVARADDSAKAIADRLNRLGRLCAEGRPWHAYKVTRRIQHMAQDLGITGRLPIAGEVVARWRKVQ